MADKIIPYIILGVNIAGLVLSIMSVRDARKTRKGIAEVRKLISEIYPSF